jgi:hypothetical protein
MDGGTRSRREPGGFRRFLENACLLGGAILIWLTIVGTVLTVALFVAAASSFDDLSFGDDDGVLATYTDSEGDVCLETDRIGDQCP